MTAVQDAAPAIRTLEPGMDFRRPEYRWEVFLRFYEFQLRYRSHPGCVYYLMPYLRERLHMDEEQALWFAFLNGNTQNPVTSYLMFREAPSMRQADHLPRWFQQNYHRLAFDTDRRHHKPIFPEAVRQYLGKMMPRQRGLIRERAELGWRAMWDWASRLHAFGRLSAFSYLEYLRIMGAPFDCQDLMLEDHDGSRSHRNGLCIVTGRDQYDWHHSNPAFNGQYSGELLDQLSYEAELLLREARDRAYGQPWERDTSYFTLESALCTYKSWHRPNRRYPNVYNDMLYARIKAAERHWPEVDLRLFWDARAASLPDALLLERNPNDPGCVPVKQNHYRETGEVIMMDLDWPCFANGFRTQVEAGAFGQRRDV